MVRFQILRPETVDFGPDKPDYGPEWADLGFERADLGPEKGLGSLGMGHMDVETDGCMDGWMDVQN